jgi:hypothetical protein
MWVSFPQFTYRRTRQGGIEWKGTLRPTFESPDYHMRIVHELWRSPRMWVLTPTLAADPPHVYSSDDNSLCLYWPSLWRWRPSESLAATIVPWAAMWLYFYEAWLVTGEWLGPSSPHRSGEPKEAQ